MRGKRGRKKQKRLLRSQYGKPRHWFLQPKRSSSITPSQILSHATYRSPGDPPVSRRITPRRTRNPVLNSQRALSTSLEAAPSDATPQRNPRHTHTHLLTHARYIRKEVCNRGKKRGGRGNIFYTQKREGRHIHARKTYTHTEGPSWSNSSYQFIQCSVGHSS